jgi:hypothetical protein
MSPERAGRGKAEKQARRVNRAKFGLRSGAFRRMHALKPVTPVPIFLRMPRNFLTFLCASLALCGTRLAAQFTEVPQTVAPGQWLMETDVATVAIDRHTPARDGIETRSSYFGYVQITTGVAKDFDVQLGLDSWREERVKGGGADERATGTGELYLRAKWKFWDGGDAGALAVLPYYRLRTTADSEIRPGISQFGCIVPYSRTLSREWTFMTMLENDWLDDGAGGRDWWLSGYVVWMHNSGGKLSWYTETATWAQGARGRWSTMTGLGVLWQVTDKFYWDAGLHVGLNRAALDWYPVLRFVWSM